MALLGSPKILETGMAVFGRSQISFTTLTQPKPAILFNYNATGGNITWNFDSLVAQRQGIHEFKASSATPYGFFIPNRTGEKIADTLSLGPVDLINLYNFHQNSTASFRTDGGGECC